jgi:hypothetical protein
MQLCGLKQSEAVLGQNQVFKNEAALEVLQLLWG